MSQNIRGNFECSHSVVFYYLNNYKIPVKTQLYNISYVLQRRVST